MKIGELGRRAGVSAKTIRYYEDIGVIREPARADNGYREYGEDAVQRLSFIRDAQATGLSLTEIASILQQRDRGERTCDHVRELLEHHIDDIDRQLRHLRKVRKDLTDMADRAATLDPADCVDPNRCQTVLPGAGAAGGRLKASARIHKSPASRTHADH